MKMEVLPSNISFLDDDKRNLEQLLNAFGSVVSLEEIASAYCKAGRDIYAAGELLCIHQGSTSCTSTSASKDDLEDASSSSEWSADNFVRNNGNSHVETNIAKPKLKKYSVSMGTVSSVIGRDYSKTRQSTDEPREVTKPPKLTSEQGSKVLVDEVPPDSMVTSETEKKDVEEFLFTMLGEGFQLEKNVIQDVLGLCGYDVTKSMERLLDLSALTLEKSEESVCMSTPKAMDQTLEVKALTSNKTIQSTGAAGSSGTGMFTKVESELSKRDKDRYNLERELLSSLFSVPERAEEPKRMIRPMREARSKRAFGSVVVEPPKEEHSVITKPKPTKHESDESEENYKALRKAAKQYWDTMKEYYKSAIDAFAGGDRTLADKLMEQGHFFAKKAREANDKSAQMLFDTSDEEEDVPLDLHDHEPKEAIRSLKCQLKYLSGIPSIQHLKVLVGTNVNDTKRAARRKRIIDLLDRESIKWSEEEGGHIIVIRVAEIKPKQLSFAKEAVLHS